MHAFLFACVFALMVCKNRTALRSFLLIADVNGRSGDDSQAVWIAWERIARQTAHFHGRFCRTIYARAGFRDLAEAQPYRITGHHAPIPAGTLLP